MGWLEGWIDADAIKDGYPFTMVGIAGAVLRSINFKSKWSAYVSGIIASAILASVLTFLIGPKSLPPLVMGSICFGAGVSNKELFLLLGKFGLFNAKKLFSTNEENEEDDDSAHSK